MAPADDEVRAWFSACGYEIQEQVGLVEGTVDRFAIQRRALMSPRIWWTIVERFPDDIEGALSNLDHERTARQADRALAIIVEGAIPEAGTPDLEASVVAFVSLRHLALHLSGALEEIRQLAAVDRDHAYVVRHGSVGETEHPDLSVAIDEWIDHGVEELLVFAPSYSSEHSLVVREVARQRARRSMNTGFASVCALLWTLQERKSKPIDMLVARGWLARHEYRSDLRRLLVQRGRRDLQGGSPASLVVVSAPVSTEETDEWLRASISGPAGERVRSLLRSIDGVAELLRRSRNRGALLAAIGDDDPLEREEIWQMRVLVALFERSSSEALRFYGADASMTQLEDAAFRGFALGGEERYSFGAGAVLADELGWLKRVGGDHSYQFTSTLVRDWLLARKLVREVRAGNDDILVRHVFPLNHVLRFLAVIAPDVASRLAVDRSAEVRREIESQVAREVQLILAHQLNRSVGAIRSNFDTVRRALDPDAIDDDARRAIGRVDNEVGHLHRLGERIRLLRDAADQPLEDVSLAETAAGVIAPLRTQYPGIDFTIDVSASLSARGHTDGLREILHCIIENATHSVTALAEDHAGHVTISARQGGETVRVEVRDNGVGVRPADHERIFQPFVTTKKGGGAAPRGTGLGLTIARRFATQMGATVGLESSNGETVFVVVFVAGGESNGR